MCGTQRPHTRAACPEDLHICQRGPPGGNLAVQPASTFYSLPKALYFNEKKSGSVGKNGVGTGFVGVCQLHRVSWGSGEPTRHSRMVHHFTNVRIIKSEEFIVGQKCWQQMGAHCTCILIVSPQLYPIHKLACRFHGPERGHALHYRGGIWCQRKLEAKNWR